jgi:AmmeMemoRadiSam system protein B/AmmeMemoRadiSam system protein A
MASAQSTALRPASVPGQRPDFTREQKQLIVSAAAEVIRATVLDEPVALADATLAGAADQGVAGAFVSLKRGGHLRSCCGGLLEQTVPLLKALRDAAARTALEDIRFPSVSPTELDHLEMEVWILYNPLPVQAHGEERAAAVVTGGKHGVVVTRGQARGLLLPGVAAEHNWDAQRFLEQVCVKAGLHPSLWKDDETALLTFEGEPIRGRLVNGKGAAATARPPTIFSPEQLPAYAEFCRRNIALLLSGATPDYYLFGMPDGHVHGLVLAIRRPGQATPLQLSQVSLRPGLPLQSGLFGLAQAAARSLVSQGVQGEDLDRLDFALMVLFDPAMHGSVADPHLAGIDCAHRAVLVMERARSGVVFDPETSPEELVSRAAEQAHVSRRSSALVFSLEALTTEAPIAVSNVPRPVRGPAERPAAVAGRFYPDDPAELARLVDQLLAGERRPEVWSAALVPHAGLAYSGRIVADVLKRVTIPKAVLVLGPKHTPLGMDWALAPQQTWLMPGFTVQSDFKLARQLSQAIPGLELDALAHQQEHAIEVELPLLARLAPEARVVGIAIGHGDLESCYRFAEGLAGLLRERKDRPLLLISSDMNHFATDAENRRLDAAAITALESLDPEEVYETVTGNGISMCGLLPAVIVLQTLRLLGGLRRSERVGYATSADVTGDRSRVVGYAGMLFGA